MHLYRLLTAALVMVAISLPAAAQAPQPWTQVGSLMCKVNANIGFIIVGHQPMECTFSPTEGSPPQSYDGAINTVGLDVGVTEGSVLGWGVFAPTSGVAQARSQENMSALPAISASVSAAAPMY